MKDKNINKAIHTIKTTMDQKGIVILVEDEAGSGACSIIDHLFPRNQILVTKQHTMRSTAEVINSKFKQELKNNSLYGDFAIESPSILTNANLELLIKDYKDNYKGLVFLVFDNNDIDQLMARLLNLIDKSTPFAIINDED